jgi:hypothetical protein
MFAPTTTNKDTTTNTFYPAAISAQIPFIIKPSDFTFSYYNPLTKHSFIPSDYLLDDITPVKKQVASTNA